MSTELIINASLPETRIALMESGEIQDLLIERASGKGITGNIYKGRVTRVLPGMQAAFVDIGLEKAAFLYVDDVYVHSEIFDEEEESTVAEGAKVLAQVGGESSGEGGASEASEGGESGVEAGSSDPAEADDYQGSEEAEGDESSYEDEVDSGAHDGDHDNDDEDQDESGSPESDDPVEMAAAPDDEGGDEGGPKDDQPSHPGTVAPSPGEFQAGEGLSQPSEGQIVSGNGPTPREEGQDQESGEPGGRRRHRRGRRGGKFRNRRDREAGEGAGKIQTTGNREQGQPVNQEYPETFQQHVSETGESASDRADLSGEASPQPTSAETGERRPTVDNRAFRSQRSKDRRVPSRTGRSGRPMRAQVNIQDLLKEGQEVIVQVAKDPIATKGARLTCHISLPGRHLVCMPTIDHVGVSRRIERDDERRRLRDIVERNRPRNLGFIVRTASGRGQAETRIRQDIDYLTHLWGEIREKAAEVTAPALVYEDLNSVLRAIRDWVTEDIDKIIVDSRYHYNDIQRFVSHFMPSLKQKVELYHGDVPIFDAYNISTELSRALERKVWLKSGGYIVIDQAEALVAIDVNTGRYVGKKNLEDTILKTNLEAVQEIAYQLRLRNCGGIIILDLIDMEKEENKQRVYRALEEALKGDRARPTIIKISELGLIEMTRKRTRDTIVRSLCESCSHCEGKGFIKSKATVAYEILREIEREVIERDVSKILIQAHPDAIDILAIDERETLDQIERRYRKQIYLQAVTDFHPEQFEVAGDKKPGRQAGEFGEVVQPLRGAAQERGQERGQDRGGHGERNERGDRGRRGKRDRGRGRDRGRDQGAPTQSTGITPLQAGASTGISPNVGSNTGPNIGNDASGGSPVHSNEEVRQQDTDNIGNAAGNQAGPSEDSDGYQEPQSQVQGPSGSQGSPRSPGSEDDDDFFENEEDRLAFLRAQAAQDAALARLSSGGSPAGQTRPGQGGPGGRGGTRDRNNRGGGSGGPGGHSGAGGRRRRGRGPGPGASGGGKFRSGSRDFGGGRGGQGGGGRGPVGGGGPIGGEGGGQTGGSEGGGGGSPAGSEGGTGGGGGDHSSPPTV